MVTKTYDPRTLAASLKVKFRSMDDLEILTKGLHVDIVLEYGEHERYRIPRDLGSTTKVFAVGDKEFNAWVADGRVTELVPTRELMDRINVHVGEARYLAVLDFSGRVLAHTEATEFGRTYDDPFSLEAMRVDGSDFFCGWFFEWSGQLWHWSFMHDFIGRGFEWDWSKNGCR